MDICVVVNIAQGECANLAPQLRCGLHGRVKKQGCEKRRENSCGRIKVVGDLGRSRSVPSCYAGTVAAGGGGVLRSIVVWVVGRALK